MKVQFEEKYNQLVRDGFCVIKGVLSSNLLTRLRVVTDKLCEVDSDKSKQSFRSQGSMLSAMSDPIFAELITWPHTLLVSQSMGFTDLTFTDGYIISKPPNSPPLFWHYDWFSWEDPTVYDKRPQQVFFMYYLVNTTRKNGCLRTIPGSHRQHNPLHEQLGNPHRKDISTADDLNRAEFSTRPDEVDVPITAGDLLIGDARLLHASHANQSNQRRTVITLWYQPDFYLLPDRIKAQMVAKTQSLPENWTATDKKSLASLLPKYEGTAEPYSRTLYRRHRKS